MKPESLAARLRRLRESKGLSQNAAAQTAGINTAPYQRLESGKATDPRLSTAKSLARLFGVTIDELAGD